MTDFSGNYKLTSFDNWEALLRELGASEEVIAKLNSNTSDLTITQNGTTFTLKNVSPNHTREVTFELGKEFDETRADGSVVKSVVTADDNKLIQIQKGDKELTIIRELVGNELKVSATAGASDKIINQMGSLTYELNITKAGPVYTLKQVSPNFTTETKFELGKEFDEQHLDGSTVKTVHFADGNKLIQTTKINNKVMKVVREFSTSSELHVTATYGSVVSIATYKRE
ncbi:unnamed protein product [Medioppia subpectinata]|uniref:Lipocalin/cytosolic fatty-acid binding domain-containing protein n=1 Tax=Medioppia subpectinata TaxID=1979941 RepID=A0A7R9KH18_9ACAR|nr:unnamed protein product [Medioppia subpectinata]CAG2103404.1 unnamed protein product [Medioppia subpectinata]